MTESAAVRGVAVDGRTFTQASMGIASGDLDGDGSATAVFEGDVAVGVGVLGAPVLERGVIGVAHGRQVAVAVVDVLHRQRTARVGDGVDAAVALIENNDQRLGAHLFYESVIKRLINADMK